MIRENPIAGFSLFCYSKYMNTFNFTEEDKQKVVEFLNQVAVHATFNLKTNELISYFKNLAHMQQTIIPKINANILEVRKVHEAKPSTSEGEI